MDRTCVSSPKAVLVAFASVVLFAGFHSKATAGVDGLCEGDHAKRRISYEIEYALTAPSGLTLDQAKQYVEGAEVLRRWVRDQVFLILAEYEVSDGSLKRRDFPYQAQAAIRDYIDLTREEDYRFPSMELHVREAKDEGIKFTACTAENCRMLGLKEDKKILFVNHGAGGELGKARSFIEDTVDLGRFLSTSYLLVPTIQRGSLCRQAGLPETCLEKKFGNQLCSGTQYYDRSSRTSTTVAIQRQRPLFCGVIDANDQLGEPWRGARGPLESKRESESWTAFQLLFALGIKISTSTSTSIVKDKVTWDPTLLCRFSRSREELRTK